MRFYLKISDTTANGSLKQLGDNNRFDEGVLRRSLSLSGGEAIMEKPDYREHDLEPGYEQ